MDSRPKGSPIPRLHKRSPGRASSGPTPVNQIQDLSGSPTERASPAAWIPNRPMPGGIPPGAAITSHKKWIMNRLMHAFPKIGKLFKGKGAAIADNRSEAGGSAKVAYGKSGEKVCLVGSAQSQTSVDVPPPSLDQYSAGEAYDTSTISQISSDPTSALEIGDSSIETPKKSDQKLPKKEYSDQNILDQKMLDQNSTEGIHEIAHQKTADDENKKAIEDQQTIHDITDANDDQKIENDETNKTFDDQQTENHIKANANDYQEIENAEMDKKLNVQEIENYIADENDYQDLENYDINKIFDVPQTASYIADENDYQEQENDKISKMFDIPQTENYIADANDYQEIENDEINKDFDVQQTENDVGDGIQLDWSDHNYEMANRESDKAENSEINNDNHNIMVKNLVKEICDGIYTNYDEKKTSNNDTFRILNATFSDFDNQRVNDENNDFY